MVGTLILGGAYQWLAKVEHAPFGPRCIWGLLLARGIGGFFGGNVIWVQELFSSLSDMIQYTACTVSNAALQIDEVYSH